MLLACTNRARSPLSSRIAVITLQVRRPKASSARFLSTTVHRSVQRSRRLSCPCTKVKKAWSDMTTPSPISRQKSSQSQAINPPTQAPGPASFPDGATATAARTTEAGRGRHALPVDHILIHQEHNKDETKRKRR